MNWLCWVQGHQWRDVNRYGYTYQECHRCGGTTYVDPNGGWPPMPHPFPPPPEPPSPLAAISRIEVVDIAPNDIIVLHSDSHLHLEQKEHIKKAIGLVWPGRQVLVMDKGLRLDVVREVPECH